MNPTASCSSDDLAKPLLRRRSGSSRVTARTESSSSNASTFEPSCFGEWVYWQRDSEKNPQCWTKVFAVAEDTWLCLYECEEMSRHTLVFRKSMWNVQVHSSRRRLKLVDASDGGVLLRMWLLNHANYRLWETCLRNAAQIAPPPPGSSDQLAVSRLSLFGIGSAGRSSRVARGGSDSRCSPRKREVVKAVCKDAFSQLKTRIKTTWGSNVS